MPETLVPILISTFLQATTEHPPTHTHTVLELGAHLNAWNNSKTRRGNLITDNNCRHLQSRRRRRRFQERHTTALLVGTAGVVGPLVQIKRSDGRRRGKQAGRHPGTISLIMHNRKVLPELSSVLIKSRLFGWVRRGRLTLHCLPASSFRSVSCESFSFVRWCCGVEWGNNCTTTIR